MKRRYNAVKRRYYYDQSKTDWTILALRVDHEMATALRDVAKRNRQSVSEFIRCCCEWGLEEIDKAKSKGTTDAIRQSQGS